MTRGVVATRALGATGIAPTVVGIGTSAPSSMPGSYGYSIDAAEAAEALDGLLEGPSTFVDTDANFGGGRGEQRIGAALARGRGASITIATKVDGDAASGRFDGSQVLRSAEESLHRLGVARVPLLHLHDPENVGFDASMAPGGPVEALARLRDDGVAGSIDVAGGSAADLGSGVINAAHFGGGLLAHTTGRIDSYGYRPVSAALAQARDVMRAACARFDAPLAAAALQFSTRDRRIHTTIVRMSRPSGATPTQELLDTCIPDELWVELDTLTSTGGVSK